MDDEKAIQDAAVVAEKWLRHQIYLQQIPGASFAITYHGKILHSANIGLADVDASKPVTDKTLFRIASISKLFTTVAVLQLVDDGKLALDDCISKYLDWFNSSDDPHVEKITIRQTLSHFSGLNREASPDDYWNNDKFPSLEEMQSYVQAKPTAYPSHHKWKYSNLAFGILGQVISTVSGEPYESYVKENIIDRLSLENTQSDIASENADLATGYSRKLPGEKRQAFDIINTGSLAAATGFASTARDLCRFLNAQLDGNDQLLSDEMKKEMRRVQWIKDESLHWGLGYHIWKFKGHDLYGHSGGFPGFISSAGLDIKNKLGVVVLTNAIDVSAVGMMQTIFATLYHCLDNYSKYGQQKELPYSEYVGRYVCRWGETYIDAVNGVPLAYDPRQYNPLDNCDTLTWLDGKVIVGEGDGFSQLGEQVELIREDDVVVGIRFGSFAMKKAAYPRTV